MDFENTKKLCLVKFFGAHILGPKRTVFEGSKSMRTKKFSRKQLLSVLQICRFDTTV